VELKEVPVEKQPAPTAIKVNGPESLDASKLFMSGSLNEMTIQPGT